MREVELDKECTEETVDHPGKTRHFLEKREEQATRGCANTCGEVIAVAILDEVRGRVKQGVKSYGVC